MDLEVEWEGVDWLRTGPSDRLLVKSPYYVHVQVEETRRN
jgi:hypothetical protein